MGHVLNPANTYFLSHWWHLRKLCKMFRVAIELEMGLGAPAPSTWRIASHPLQAATQCDHASARCRSGRGMNSEYSTTRI